MVITDLNAIGEGSPWPIPSEQERMDKYFKNSLLFEGKHGQVWPDLNPGAKMNDPSRSFNLMENIDRSYVDLTVNWYKISTKVFADLLCGEPFKVIANEQATADRIVNDNRLVLQTYDAVMAMIKDGTAIFKVRFDQHGVIDLINPAIWFPVVSPDNSKEIIAHALMWSFKEGDKEYVRQELHKKGSIINKLFRIDGGKLVEVPLTTFERYAPIDPYVLTGINEFLVIPVNNILGSDGVYGQDDFTDMNSLVKELERRLIENSRILTKHAEPSVSGPASKIDIDPYSGESTVVGGGQYFGYSTGEPVPQFMTWDGQLPASFSQIDQIVSKLFMVSELSPAAVGDLKQGLAESGSALKRLMLRTLAKVNRLRLRIDPALKQVLKLTASLEVLGRLSGSTELNNIQIMWQDGLPSDETELVNNEVAKKMAGLTTIELALKKLNPDMSDADIKDSVMTINDESVKTNGV